MTKKPRLGQDPFSEPGPLAFIRDTRDTRQEKPGSPEDREGTKPERPEVRKSRRQDVRKSRRQEVQASGLLNKQNYYEAKRTGELIQKVTLHLPLALVDKLKDQAREKRVTLSEIVRQRLK